MSHLKILDFIMRTLVYEISNRCYNLYECIFTLAHQGQGLSFSCILLRPDYYFSYCTKMTFTYTTILYYYIHASRTVKNEIGREKVFSAIKTS